AGGGRLGCSWGRRVGGRRCLGWVCSSPPLFVSRLGWLCFLCGCRCGTCRTSRSGSGWFGRSSRVFGVQTVLVVRPRPGWCLGWGWCGWWLVGWGGVWGVVGAGRVDGGPGAGVGMLPGIGCGLVAGLG